jgi:hypothetical protein
MSGEMHQSQKTQLAFAVAKGACPGEWARENQVPTGADCRWAQEPDVRSHVESIRRSVLDRAVSRLTARAAGAAGGIANLAGDADSEAVRLSALRATYTDMIAVSRFGGLEDRVTELEEQFEKTAPEAARW